MGSLTVEDGDDVLPTTMTPLTLDDFDGILAKYVGNEMKLALLLDYDGTLAPICPHPDLATIPEETKRVCGTELKYNYSSALRYILYSQRKILVSRF